MKERKMLALNAYVGCVLVAILGFFIYALMEPLSRGAQISPSNGVIAAN